MNYKEENGTEPILTSEYETWWIDSDVQRKRGMTKTADFLEKANSSGDSESQNLSESSVCSYT